MCGINDRIDRTELIDNGYPVPGSISCEFGNKQTSRPVFLRRERAFSQIQRQVFEEPPVVIEGLGFAMAEWIDCHAKTRGPVIGQRVVDTLSARAWASIQLFLLPSKTEETSDVLVETPGVLNVAGMVIRERGEARVTEFTTNDLETNRYKLGRTIVQLHWEQRQLGGPAAGTGPETQP